MAKITLEVYSARELLTEATVAYVRQSCPSALLKVLSEALTLAGSKMVSQDAAFLYDLTLQLKSMSDDWRKYEEHYYASTDS